MQKAEPKTNQAWFICRTNNQTMNKLKDTKFTQSQVLNVTMSYFCAL